MRHRLERLTPIYLALILGGCGTDAFELDETTETLIGPSGGVARSAAGDMQVRFAPGALDREVAITIETFRDGPPDLIGPIYDLGPDGLVFMDQVVIETAALPGATQWVFLGPDGREPLETTSDPITGWLRADLEHFSRYGTAAGAPLDAGVADVGTPLGGPDAGAPLGGPDVGAPDMSGPDMGPSFCAQSFRQNSQPLLDILFVIDNTGGMAVEQTLVARDLSHLVSFTSTIGASLHVGFTTTDMLRDEGRLLDTPIYLTSSTPNLLSELKNRAVRVLIGGRDEAESGLEASRAALSAPLATGANSGFVRDEASLWVVYASDEAEQSDLAGFSNSSTAAYASFLNGIHGPRRVQANAIVSPTPTCTSTTIGNATSAGRYADVAQATGGNTVSICGNSYAGALNSLKSSEMGFVHAFTLTSPAPASLSAVLVGNTPAAPGSYSYDASTGVLDFAAGAIPAASATVEVRYACP